MKNILLACGSGIVTSTAVNMKLTKILDEKGFKGKYKVTQCKVQEAASKSTNFDFLVSTTMAPAGLQCPYVNGVCFLTGMNVDKTVNEIIELMNK